MRGLHKAVTAAAVIALAAHIGVFGWRVLTVERRLTPDSFSYISVARNLAAGDGLVQSSPGFNQPGFWQQPSGLGFHEKTGATHNVGYSFLILAVGTAAGLEFTDAALLISVAAYAASLLLTYRVAFLLGGRDAAGGLLAVAVALHLCHKVFLYAWTEPFSIAVLLAVLALMAGGMTPYRSLVAGGLAGVALLVRTAMLPMVALGMLACLVPKRGRWRNSVLFAAAPAAATLFAVAAVTQQKVGGEPLPAVAADFLWLMRMEFAALAILALLCLWLYRREIHLAKLKGNTLALLLVAWVVGYSLFLILSKWQYTFEFSFRTSSPLTAVLVLLYGTLLSLVLRRTSGARRTAGAGLALLAVSIAFALARDRSFLLTAEVASDEARIAASQRLEWVQENVRPGDFVAGMDTMDLPYYFQRQVPTSISFSPTPYGIHVSGRDLASLVRNVCGEYDGHYLVLRKYPRAFDMLERYGSDMRDLAVGKPVDGFELTADLADGTVYRMNHCSSLRG